jgi:1,4-alpha-glucan branching enzyme
MSSLKQASDSNRQIEEKLARLLKGDPYLHPYEDIIRRRLTKIAAAEKRLTRNSRTLADFASGHEYFGLHFQDNQWIFREWAPNAAKIHLVGDMSGWQESDDFALKRLNDDGVWEIRLAADRIRHQDLYRLRIHQDPETLIFNAQVWQPDKHYNWRFPDFKVPQQAPLIYEAHVGMAQEEAGIGSYQEFTDLVLPRIVKSGYNTIQLMAIQEHPYYGSFGYQVSSFFAASSRFGTPDDLKSLIDAAHASGLAIFMDIIHSHAVSNEIEGLSRFDGTLHQYFHDGPRGRHELWDSRCFDYGKLQVLHFLLSNCRFWLDEYRFDGFRFDGITSMLYLHHGMNKAFTSYDDYFDDSVDEDALTYLALAGKLIHSLRPDARTIAEDVSGMPGLAAPLAGGGYGFDYRFAMGVPDNWIRLIKEVPDEDWPIGHIWHELTNRRKEEKTISYAESHDQALVGDKSIIFRLIDADMYDHMQVDDQHIRVDRGMALHKMIRLVTLATAGAGYLNFMGNEFGHPEWIDFPREGNNWSYYYARRQWHLADDPGLKYKFNADFDRDMIAMTKTFQLLDTPGPHLVYEHADNKLMVFMRAGLLFVFNFHPGESYSDFRFNAPPGKYTLIFTSDAACYGGHQRLQPDQAHLTLEEVIEGHTHHFLSLYLPARTAQVLKHTD